MELLIDNFTEKYLDCFDNEYYNIYKTHLKKYIKRKNINSYSFVGLYNGRPIAYILCERTILSGINLLNIYVENEFRNRGIAKDLFYKAKDRMKSKETIIAFYNKDLRKFYVSLGFNIGDRLEVAVYPLYNSQHKRH